MSLITEDGTQVSGAVSYASEAELNVYADSQGISIAGDESELLLRASIYVETLNFLGNKLTKAQRMQWPRSGVIIDGFTIETDEIPQLLQDLQMEVAISIDGGIDPLGVVSRATKKEKVGDIEVEYSDQASQADVNPKIYAMANKLIGIGGGISIPIYRS